MTNYNVVQLPEFRQKLAELEPAEPVSELLEIVFGALADDPYAFRPAEIVDHSGNVGAIRSVRTQIFFGESGIAPPMVIFFDVHEDSKRVRLLDITRRAGFGLGFADF